MTLKLVFTASLLDVQHLRDSVEIQPASLLVVPLGKALYGIPHLGVVNVLELDQLPGSSYRELERFVSDRKRAGACLRSPTVSP